MHFATDVFEKGISPKVPEVKREGEELSEQEKIDEMIQEKRLHRLESNLSTNRRSFFEDNDEEKNLEKIRKENERQMSITGRNDYASPI